MTKDEALKLALDFIERVNKDGWILADFEPQMYAAIAAIKEALAQPEQEPVACDCNQGQVCHICDPITHLSQHTWVRLAKEDRLCAKYMQDAPDGIEAVIDYIEAKLKEKNT